MKKNKYSKIAKIYRHRTIKNTISRWNEYCAKSGVTASLAFWSFGTPDWPLKYRLQGKNPSPAKKITHREENSRQRNRDGTPFSGKWVLNFLWNLKIHALRKIDAWNSRRFLPSFPGGFSLLVKSRRKRIGEKWILRYGKIWFGFGNNFWTLRSLIGVFDF